MGTPERTTELGTRLVWQCGVHAVELGDRTVLMGILNVTPDSFSDGGRFFEVDAAVDRALQLRDDGATIVDIGGESTRPGADPIPSEEEIRRVAPVVERLQAEAPDLVLSVDTSKAAVARAAVDVGASIVNDVSAGRDPRMLDAVASTRAGYVAMHMQGEPGTMQADPHYSDVVEDVRSFLGDRLRAAEQAGIQRDRLCVDPGLGFGKTLEHNLALLRDIHRIVELGVPVLAGPSRKRFIGTLTGAEDPADRVEGTAAVVAWLVAQGTHIVRVHDVREMTRVVQVVDAIVLGSAP
ncbi:MAG: dihydropteroate synthase [Actinomycetota bacterium]